MRLRLILPVFVALAVLAPRTSHTVEYPWCAQYGAAGGGGRVCGFSSFEQCLETVRGVGGFCERNLLYAGPEHPAKTARKHKSK